MSERFQNQQALFGSIQIDSSALLVFHDPIVIEFWRVTSQRQSKAILPRPLTVARSLVAAIPGENRLNVVDERWRRRVTLVA